MASKQHSRAKFKEYDPHQSLLLPPDLDELIPADHVVRVVSSVIDQIDLDEVLSAYSGGGRPSYHPRMLLKVFVYGYLNNVYSSRKLEQSLCENIHFMWLAGMQRPDHNTLARFRSDRLGSAMQSIFGQIVRMLIDAGRLDLAEAVYLDGTTLEANANRYTFVWRKRMERSRTDLAKQLEELWEYASQVNAADLGPRPSAADPIDARSVAATVAKIDAALKEQPVDPAVKRRLRTAKKEWPERLERYADQDEQLGERNSYSKTDPSATFMQLKENHRRKGQTKPGYNWQVSTQDQYIVCYSVHQSPADTTTLPDHVRQFEQTCGTMPSILVADAAYGSEENYAFLQEHTVDAYVKYNMFDREQKPKYHKDPRTPFRSDSMPYDEHNDYFTCPNGKRLHAIDCYTETSKTGYQKQITRYQAEDCEGCQLRAHCHDQAGNRIIKVNHRLRAYKASACTRLLSDVGQKYRKRRSVDVEPVFGMVKHNRAFRRCSLRGLDKVTIELGLIAIAHNLAKWAAICTEKSLKQHWNGLAAIACAVLTLIRRQTDLTTIAIWVVKVKP